MCVYYLFAIKTKLYGENTTWNYFDGGGGYFKVEGYEEYIIVLYKISFV